MRVLVCGGRDFDDPAVVYRTLDLLHGIYRFTALMQGGQRGADRLASDWARDRGIQRYVCKADWDKHGPRAGPIRNSRMLDWKPELVVAFPGDIGTADMVRKARAAKIDVVEVEVRKSAA